MCARLQALIAGCGIAAFVYHDSAAALVTGLFCAGLIFGAAYTSHYHYRKYAKHAQLCGGKLCLAAPEHAIPVHLRRLSGKLSQRQC